MTDTETSKPASKKTKHVGDIVDVSVGGEVTRPDGRTHLVRGGRYYLDEPGTFVVDGNEVEVKA